MPYTIRKVRGKNCYSVKKAKGKKNRTKSRCTTLKKAKAQVRLMNAIDHDPSFVPTGK
jgi:hypothetical protein